MKRIQLHTKIYPVLNIYPLYHLDADRFFISRSNTKTKAKSPSGILFNVEEDKYILIYFSDMDSKEIDQEIIKMKQYKLTAINLSDAKDKYPSGIIDEDLSNLYHIYAAFLGEPNNTYKDFWYIFGLYVITDNELAELLLLQLEG